MFFAVCSLLWFDSGVGLPFIREKIELKNKSEVKWRKSGLEPEKF